MKKTMAIILAMLLALSCAAGYAATGDAIIGRDEEGNSDYFVRSVFTDGEVVYISMSDEIATYRVGDSDIVLYDYDIETDDEDAMISWEYLPFYSDGELYAIALKMSYEDAAQFKGAYLLKLSLVEEEEERLIKGETLRELDWSMLIEYYDDEEYAMSPEGMFAAGDRLIIRYWEESGEYSVASLDLQSGRMEKVDALQDVYSITPYRDGTLLVQQFSYQNPDSVTFLSFDPESEGVQELARVEITNYSAFEGIAYDGESDRLYCLKGGEICPLDLESGEVGEGVSSMPLEVYSGGSGACVLKGGYYVYCSNGVAVRNLDPEQKAETTLRIYDPVWSDAVNKAQYLFSNAHGEVDVVVNRDYGESEDIISSMMNRSDDIDVYVLSASYSEFDALISRGYMMELDDSERIHAFADSMYPSLREGISREGRLVAIPMEAYSWTLGVNEKALGQLGMSLEDVPANWWDFLDFLASLSGRIPEETGIMPFESYYSYEDLRSTLFYNIFNAYQNYVNITDPTMGYNTELMIGLLDKLDSIDFEALGYMHDDTDEDDTSQPRVSYSYDSEKMLFDMGIGCTFNNFYSEMTPVLMSIKADTPAYLMLDANVAFINPYTKNPDAALAFMEQMVDSLPDGVRYDFVPALDQPVRGKWNESNLQTAQETIQLVQMQLEKAEEADRQELEEQLAAMQEDYERMVEESWEISEKDIAWYRANDENIRLTPVNWLYRDSSGEAWELMNQYMDGQISAEEMLAGIDRKVQMMLLEGN